MLEYLILFLAAFMADAISGTAGFGNALLLPLLVLNISPVQAVPLLTIVQLIGNLSRAGFGFAEIRWRAVRFGSARQSRFERGEMSVNG